MMHFVPLNQSKKTFFFALIWKMSLKVPTEGPRIRQILGLDEKLR